MENQKEQKNILWFSEISKKDGALVGGKNASLGEMFNRLIVKRIRVPNGFCLTSKAYWYYLDSNGITGKIKEILDKFNPKSMASLKKTGASIRALILGGKFPKDLEDEIIESYKKLSGEYGEKNMIVAVRSSATAEDLKDASFAGQMESYLNISGKESLLRAIKNCTASLFTDRAIAYREEKGFDRFKIALSAGVLKMIRSDLASAGIMFTLDTETGFRNVVSINSIWGAGEMIVKGKITPDQFYVFKPTLQQAQGYKPIISRNLGRKDKKYIFAEQGLKEVKVSKEDEMRFSVSDEDILTLAKWAMLIEEHYNSPQDIEWAKDGKTGELFIVQSRPETIHSLEKKNSYEEYKISQIKEPILNGIAIGSKIGEGRVRVISDVSKIGEFKRGEVLVTKMTDPDWCPIFPLASAIITEEGGATCHAAIVSREMGIPAMVGVKGALKALKTGQTVTVDCTSSRAGKIFLGKIPYTVKKYDLDKLPQLETKIMINIGSPDLAFKYSSLPNEGVGLAREEFIIAEKIKIHPLALYHFKELKDKKAKKIIEEITAGYKDKKKYFIDKLAEGVSQIAAAFYPKTVIVRFSDFKTNEYKNLIGGEIFERTDESNPMMGFRGACRYIDKNYQPAFEMECQAIKKAREEFGLKNITVMVPFCRTLEEGKAVVGLIEKFGLERGKDGLQVIMMCEIPSNVILAEEFLEIFDGMSIGSNDLTQLTLGLDRDNSGLAHIGDERNEAVKRMIERVIKVCISKNKYCGICGDAPSSFLDFADFLIENKISSISLSPDAVIKTIISLSKKNN